MKKKEDKEDRCDEPEDRKDEDEKNR